MTGPHADDDRAAAPLAAGADPAHPDATAPTAIRPTPPPPVHHERRRRTMGWRSTDVIRTAALVIAMYVGLRLLWVANPLFLTAFLGALFGLAVASGVDWLQGLGGARFRIPRGAAAGLIVFSFIGLMVGFGAWMAPTLREQATELRRRLPEAIDRVETWADARRGGLLGILFGLETEARQDSAAAAAGGAGGAARPGTAPQPAAGTAPASGPAPAVDTTGGRVKLRDRIGQQLSGATRYFFPFLSSTLSAFAGLLVVMFLAIYIGADPDLYHDGLMHLFPHRSRDRAGEVLSAVAAVLRRWMYTQLIAMAVIGGVSTVLLLVLRVKAAFALGILAGLFEFIPTIGPILSAVPAVAMGFLDSPEKALYVALGYVAIQFAENHLLIPLLMKGGVDLPPAVTILSQALMALVFGFLGLLVAVPLVAATMVAVKMLYVEGVVGDEIRVLGRSDDEDADDDEDGDDG